jgi:hypothetical protein
MGLVHRSILAGAAALLACALAPGAARAEAPSFESPEAALDAFRGAVETDDDGAALLALFGGEHRDELIGGDPAEARLSLERLRVGIQQALRFDPDGDDGGVLLIGAEAWPMPIPLAKQEGAWRFDAAAGLEEIRDRRIGRHELAAIELAREFVDAQIAYASEDRDGDEVLEYAQRLLSESGTRNGLYWPNESGDDPSPLDEFVARADAQGYREHQRLGEPYRGYYFRVLTKQGPTPPGGAYDYVINGNMIAGFALVAWPAEYGNSGITTFIVNQQGRVYQKDLGADTGRLVEAMEAYDPGEGWTVVPEAD